MLDRWRLVLIIGILALMIITYFDLALIPLGILAFVLADFYAGYWGLTIRRRLVVRAYRNQALGVSISALYIVLVGVALEAFPTNAGLPNQVINALVDFGFMLVIFFWINTTVSVARRSDPLEQDTFHFRSVRFIWAAAIIIPAVLALAHNPMALVYTVATQLDSLSVALGIAPFVIVLPFGAVLLFVSSSRSMDRTLGHNIRWYTGALTAYLAVELIGAVWRTTGGNSSPYALLIDPIFLGGQFLAAYCFYRSARALVPISTTL